MAQFKGSVQFSRSAVSDSATPWTAARQASLFISNSRSLLKLMSMSRWRHSTISSSVVPFSPHLQSFPISGSFLVSQFFASGGQSIGASALHQSFKWTFRVDFLQDWLVWSPYSPRDPQESSPTPQFKSINSSALSFIYSRTLTSIHDHWKNHSFD